ncbi:MAG: adenylyl-sulfate reductase [Gammaproteobacteria bacterium]|nr:adenylyl-sulfate reductase [Gammaproteobacteria bacterium]
MFTTNPFAELSSFIPVAAMQGYVVLMVLLVIGGTILDMIHKGSAKYFFENAKKSKKNARRSVSSGTKAGLAVQTLTNEVLLSAEFKNPQRRVSHLLMMYGFIIFVVTTAVMIFSYPTAADSTPGYLPLLWHLGALMLCIGGYWFWFVIRVDVSAEGQPWYRLTQGDIFIVSLLATATFGLIWSIAQSTGAAGWDTLFFVLFIISSTTLFSTVLWSKFAHMFFKPAAAFQKKVTKADGSQENLPDVPELSAAETKTRYPDIPEYMGDNPGDMGLGIKREAPQHY